MTIRDFRRIALSMEGAAESSHMAHPDFRVGGKIFATLGYPDQASGMIKLNAEQQREFILAEPDIFAPVKGAWGDRGSTLVRIENAKEESLREAMLAACRNLAAPRKKSPTRR